MTRSPHQLSNITPPEELVSKYLVALRAQAEHCSYGDVLDDMLWDRLVYGVSNNNIQHRLLTEKDLTYKKALELHVAHAIEAAAQGSCT